MPKFLLPITKISFYLVSFNTNYIIFRNVEKLWKKYFICQNENFKTKGRSFIGTPGTLRDPNRGKELYWDPWNLKRPKQGPREFYGSPLEPEGTQTGAREFHWSPLEPEGTQIGVREFHWSPLEPEGIQTGVREFHWSPLEPEGTQIGAEGVVLAPPGIWRDPDRGQGRCTGPPWNLKGPSQGQGNFIRTYGTWGCPAKGHLWGRPDGMEREREKESGEAMAMAAHAYLLPAAAQLSHFPAIFWHTWKLLSGLDKSRVSALLTSHFLPIPRATSPNDPFLTTTLVFNTNGGRFRPFDIASAPCFFLM